jgi:succinoglycan biosynthesis transport protein ExoP
VELGRYFDIIKRWWWLMLVSVALAAGASYVYSERQPRIYASRTTLMVGSGIQNPNPNERELGLSRTLAEIYAQLVLREPIMQAVVDKLGLDMSSEQLASMVQTNVIYGAQLLEITVLDVNPQRARVLADAIANELILQSPTGPRGEQERQAFIQAQLDDLQAKIEKVDGQIKELEDSILTMTSAVEIAEAQSRLRELEALKSDYQSNYTQLLSYLSGSSVNRLAIVEPAAESSYPIAPNVKRNLMVAAVAGLALAISAIVLLEFFDETLVWRHGENRPIFGVPVLGGIGKLWGGANKILVRDELWSPEADALRNVRSQIFLAAAGGRPSTLMITSPLPEEGKSFVAANLAAITAAAGSRVVLVDADLRKPSLHEMFDMPNVIGLSDVLAASETDVEAMLERGLKPTDIDNLLLLPAGKPAADPAFLLSSPTLDRLLERLRDKASLIIVDGGPLLVHTDPIVLAMRLDGVVLVVKNGRTTRSSAKRAIERLSTLGLTNLLGIIYNGVSLHYGYYYAYKRSLVSKPVGSDAVSQKGALGWLGRFGLKSRDRLDAADDETLLTLSDVAEYLGVTEEMARQWCESGRIPAIHAGRRWRVRLQDLSKFARAYGGEPLRSDLGPSEASS